MKTKCIKYHVSSIIVLVLFLFFSYLLLTTYYLLPVIAADSTQSAQSSSPSATIKEKIDEIKREIASKAAIMVPDVNKKLANKVFWGIISEKTDNKIVVVSKDVIKQIIIDEYTSYQSLSKKTSKPKSAALTAGNFSKDDFIAALGDVDDKGELRAKKVIKLDPIKIPEITYFWGQIVSVKNSRITLKLKDSTKQEIFAEINTDFFLGNEESSILDAKLNKFMVARGTYNEAKSFFADYIYFIPTAGFIKPEPKVATNSATANPSVSIKK